MTQIAGAAVRTAQRPTPAVGSADVIRDLDLNKYLFWSDTYWVDDANTPVATAPFAQASPVLGSAQSGVAITCPSGAWAGYPTPTFTYQWFLDNLPISGATSATYTPAVSDAQHALSCAVTATNGALASTARTNAVIVAPTAALASITPVSIASGAPVGSPVAQITGAVPGTAIRLVNNEGLFAISQDGAAIVSKNPRLAPGTYTVPVTLTAPDGRSSVRQLVTVVVGAAGTTTLQALSVSQNSATVGTSYSGTVSGKTSGSTLSLTGAGAAGLSVSNGIISGTPTAAGVVNVVETLDGATGSPRTSSAVLTVAAAAAQTTLGTLSLSNTAGTVGTAYSGTISGKTAGSTIALSGAGAAGLSISGTTVSGTPTATGAVNLIETLAGAANTPKTTASALTIGAAPVTLAALTLSTATATAGSAYSATIAGKTSGSTLAATSSDGTTLSISGSTLSGTFSAAGTPTITITETLAGATNSPRTSTNSVTVRAAGSSVGLAMTQLLAGRVYQRLTKTGGAPGKGTGNIPVPITLSAAASTIEYRLRDADSTSTTVKDWAVAGTNVAASATSVTCAGVPADKKGYLLDLRANGDDSQIVLGTARVMMGRIIAICGQSLAVRLLSRIGGTDTMASLGVPISPFGWVNAAYYDSSSRQANFGSWAQPADGSLYDSAFLGDYLNRTVAASGVACGIVGSAVGGVNAAYFNPGAANGGYDKFMASLDQAGGAFEHFLWLQGHTDAQNGLSASAYSAQLDKILTSLNSKTSIAFTKAICTIPNISSNQWGTPDQINAIRNGAASWCAANSGVFVQPFDIELGDGVHQTQAGALALSRHFFRATRVELGLTAKAAPVMASASRADGSKAIVIPVTLSAAATKLVAAGTPAIRFNVFPKGTTANPLALDSTTPIVVGTNTITLNLAADPGNGVGVDVYYCYPLDPAAPGQASGIYDDAVDGDGITVGRGLTVNLAAISTTAAAGGNTGGSTGGGTGGTTTPTGPALTMSSSAAYADAPSGFGKQRSAGSGATAAGASPLIGTQGEWTIQLRALIPAAPGGTIVLCGQDSYVWIALNGSGQLVVNVAGAYVGTSTPGADGNNPMIADNKIHEIRVAASAAGIKAFVDGVTKATRTDAAPKWDAISTPFGVCQLGGSGYVPASGVLVDEVAVFNKCLNTADYTPTGVPLTGTEAYLKALWHLDDNGASGF